MEHALQPDRLARLDAEGDDVLDLEVDRVADANDFEIEDIVPFGIETGEPVRLQGMFHPAGSTLTVAEATRSRINAFGIEYEGPVLPSYSIPNALIPERAPRRP